jgi:hypothetical protein
MGHSRQTWRQVTHGCGIGASLPRLGGATGRRVTDATIALSGERLATSVILIPEVALDYIQLRSFQEQIAIGEENIKSSSTPRT